MSETKESFNFRQHAIIAHLRNGVLLDLASKRLLDLSPFVQVLLVWLWVQKSHVYAANNNIKQLPCWYRSCREAACQHIHTNLLNIACRKGIWKQSTGDRAYQV